MRWERKERRRKETQEELKAMREATMAFFSDPPRSYRRAGSTGMPRSVIFTRRMDIPKGK